MGRSEENRFLGLRKEAEEWASGKVQWHVRSRDLPTGKRISRLESGLEMKARHAREFQAARAAIGLSQTQLARALDVSARTVQGWEIGTSVPNGPARRLLTLFDKHPEILKELGVQSLVSRPNPQIASPKKAAPKRLSKPALGKTGKLSEPRSTGRRSAKPRARSERRSAAV